MRTDNGIITFSSYISDIHKLGIARLSSRFRMAGNAVYNERSSE